MSRWALPAFLPLLLLTACAAEAAAPTALPPDPPGHLTVVADDFSYLLPEGEIPAGTVSVTFRNEGSVIHDLLIEGRSGFRLEAPPGGSDTGIATLPPGRHVVFCSIPGHREAGMEAVLEVTER